MAILVNNIIGAALAMGGIYLIIVGATDADEPIRGIATEAYGTVITAAGVISLLVNNGVISSPL